MDNWRRDLILIAIAVGLGSAIAIIVILVVGGSQICLDESIFEKAPKSCAEYWLNRYQTLISAILALVSAILVVRVTFVQANAAREQIAELRRQNQLSHIPTIDRQYEKLSLVESALGTFAVNAAQFRKAVSDHVNMSSSDLFACVKVVTRNMEESISKIESLKTEVISNSLATEMLEMVNPYFECIKIRMISSKFDIISETPINESTKNYMSESAIRGYAYKNEIAQIPPEEIKALGRSESLARDLRKKVYSLKWRTAELRSHILPDLSDLNSKDRQTSSTSTSRR